VVQTAAEAHVKASELNLWKFIIPVVGAILSWVLVPDEKPEWLTIAGMVIITASLIGFYKNGNKVHSDLGGEKV
jgi:drug/metabolite transporter (DMT)-like permease